MCYLICPLMPPWGQFSSSPVPHSEWLEQIAWEFTMLLEFSEVTWCSVSWLHCMMLLNESVFGVSVFKEVFKVK